MPRCRATARRAGVGAAGTRLVEPATAILRPRRTGGGPRATTRCLSWRSSAPVVATRRYWPLLDEALDRADGADDLQFLAPSPPPAPRRRGSRAVRARSCGAHETFDEFAGCARARYAGRACRLADARRVAASLLTTSPSASGSAAAEPGAAASTYVARRRRYDAAWRLHRVRRHGRPARGARRALRATRGQSGRGDRRAPAAGAWGRAAFRGPQATATRENPAGLTNRDSSRCCRCSRRGSATPRSPSVSSSRRRPSTTTCRPFWASWAYARGSRPWPRRAAWASPTRRRASRPTATP